LLRRGYLSAPVKPVIEFKDVVVMREGNSILGPLSMIIEPSQRWVIVGPNGAGKTTSLQLMATNSHPTTGRFISLERSLAASMYLNCGLGLD
jgi:iron complex transport system ATP-binding protein